MILIKNCSRNMARFTTTWTAYIHWCFVVIIYIFCDSKLWKNCIIQAVPVKLLLMKWIAPISVTTWMVLASWKHSINSVMHFCRDILTLWHTGSRSKCKLCLILSMTVTWMEGYACQAWPWPGAWMRGYEKDH